MGGVRRVGDLRPTDRRRQNIFCGLRNTHQKPNWTNFESVWDALRSGAWGTNLILIAKGKDIKKDKILYKGDIIILFKGGHGFKFYKNTKIIEIKQGPYIEGKDKKILKIK